jgi:CHAD domain-containing protein
VSVREREIKLAAPPGFHLPPLTDPGSDIFERTPRTIELDATYYDTDDLRLARAGALLRHRNDEGWMVKLPSREADPTALVRDEHVFSNGIDGEPPEPALDLVRALVRSAPVARVARLRTTRRHVPIHAADGTLIADVADDRVDVIEGTTLERTFHEVEVELTDAATDVQRTALLARLRASGAAVPDPTPKIAHALGPRATAAPDIEIVAVGPNAPLDHVVRAAIATCVAKLVTHDPGVRLGGDAEDVHQARVATRRLRSHLRTFASLVDEHWATGLSDELRWLGEVLGAVRDADVLLDRLETKIAELDPMDQKSAELLLERLRADLVHRRELLLAALRGDRYVALLDAMVAAARRPRLLLRIDDESDADVLRGLVRRPWHHLRDSVAALTDDPADAELHAVRIRVKRARYAAEAVEPAFGKRARAFARALTDLQDLLGDHQDAVIAAEWLRQAAAKTHDEAVGFAAGLLAGLEHQDAHAARARWRDAWKLASRRRLHDWL